MWGIANKIAVARLPRPARLLACCILAPLAAACKEPPPQRYVPEADLAEAGHAAILRTGCAACHEIPGIAWPRGRIGPSLVGFDDIGLIAGALPNDAGTLARFVRNAPAVKPGSTMPAMPLTEQEARAVAAFLYRINDA